MAENQTVPTGKSVMGFLKTIKDEKKRKDCIELAEIMTAQSGYEAVMWGPAIIGFGSYHYVYDSGREGDSTLAAFSPRVGAIVLYLSSKFKERDGLLKKLGKAKIDKRCIYFKSLEDIDKGVLEELIKFSVKHLKSLHPDK